MSRLNGIPKKQIIENYRTMVLSRKLDEKMINMLKQGKSYFHIGAAGHEAAQIAAANLIRKGEDWSFPYYRDAAYCLGIGMTGKELLLNFLAKADDPNSGGRQMPQHYGHKNLRIISQSSPTGTQFLQAVGCAFSCQFENRKELVYVSAGEGTTSQGDFHEALNWASNSRAPVIFHIQDNEYAISTHRSQQMSDSVYVMTAGYKNLSRYDVNGTNYFESYVAFKQAFERARKGKGPSVVISHVVRLLPHSSSDDQRKYRTKDELANDQNKDPIKLMESLCIKEKLFSEVDFEKIRNEIQNQVDKDAQWAELQESPDINSALKFIYSSSEEKIESKYEIISDNIVIVDAINHAMEEEMHLNDKMVIYGQYLSA